MNIKCLIGMISMGLSLSCTELKDAQNTDDSYPAIFPDYTFTAVPCNIAPLNFEVENAENVRADFSSENTHLLTVTGKREICIPEDKWHAMLEKLKDKDLQVAVSVWNASHPKGVKYKPFTIRIASDAIDGWIAYRLIEPGYEGWNAMGIYQRNLTSFEEKEIMTNRADKGSCLNCHSFAAYSPDRMMLHVRGKNGGTALWMNGKLSKVALNQIGPKKNGSYPMWHPAGRYIAFSSNETKQSFYSEGEKQIEVYDLQSDLIIYDTQTGKVLSDSRFMESSHWETFPAWSMDGKWLYYCSALARQIPAGLKQLKYSLCRVGFDGATGMLGERIDTLYNAEREGGSASYPRISPDGQYLLYTKAAFGTFPIHHQESDLKMLRLMDGTEMDTAILNSGEADSYHAWSSNSRWILFSSRRIDGRYTRIFIAWMDAQGKLHKPFLLPQRSPEHNVLRMKSYNIPEFIKGEVCLPKGEMNSSFFPKD